MKKIKILIPLIPSILSGIAALPTIVSCKDKLSGPIFEITNDGVLMGFNSEWSKEDIAKKLEGTTTLAIPSNVKRIASKAFYAPNTSFDFKTYSSIPFFIEKLDLSAATQLNRIESEAFRCAPFRTIIFNKSNICVEDSAFVYNYNLSYIDLSDFDTFPLSTWSINAWDLWHAEKGFIKIKNALIAEAWQTYFSTNSGFIFDAKHWALDISTFDKIFTFDHGTITGLTESFIYASSDEQSRLLYETSTESSTLLIPTFHNEPITAIAKNAFYVKKEVQGEVWWESTIDSHIKYLYFLDGGAELTIGEEAFKKAPFREVRLSSTINKIERHAFNGLSNLWYLDASSCNSHDDWSANLDEWAGCPDSGDIVVKADLDNYRQIATFLKQHGVPNNWNIKYNHASAYDISYDTVLNGFHNDLSEQDIIKMMGWDDQEEELTMPINNVSWVTENAFCRNGESKIPLDAEHPLTINFSQGEEECRYIGSHAFSSSPAIAQVNFSSSLKAINSYAFYHDENLKEINIPSSLQTLDDMAFCDCTSLELINMTSFDSFTKPDGWSTKSVFGNVAPEGNVALDTSLESQEDVKDKIAAYLFEASNGIIDLKIEPSKKGWHWGYVSNH